MGDEDQIRKKRRLGVLPKVCFACAAKKDGFSLFIFDINDGVPEDRRFCQISLSDFGLSEVLAIDSIIYLIKSRRCGFGSVFIYRYEIPKNVLEMGNFKLSKSMVKEASPLLSPKKCCKFMRYGTRILAFSSEIEFSSSDAPSDYYDFELYDPCSGKSKGLAALTIKRLPLVEEGEDFARVAFLDAKTRSFVPLFNADYFAAAVNIKGFGLIGGHFFFVKTGLGLNFKIDLESDTGVWELCEDYLLCYHESEFFFMMDDKICIDSYGAYSMIKIPDKEIFNVWEKNTSAVYDFPADYIQGVKSTFESGDFGTAAKLKVRLEGIARCLPLVPIGRGVPTVMTLVEAMNGACIVQVDKYKEEDCVDPDIHIVFLQFDFSKFPSLDYSKNLYGQIVELIVQHEEDGEWGWARRIKSFKVPNHPFPRSGPSISNLFTLEI